MARISKPSPATAASGVADATTPKSPDGQDEQTAGKPQLLPWRSRLKDFRLAARVFGKETTPSAQPSEPVPTPSDEPAEDTGGDFFRDAADQPHPGQAGPATGTNRRDPVIE